MTVKILGVQILLSTLTITQSFIISSMWLQTKVCSVMLNLVLHVYNISFFMKVIEMLDDYT